jgi:hypothetical protein
MKDDIAKGGSKGFKKQIRPALGSKPFVMRRFVDGEKNLCSLSI